MPAYLDCSVLEVLSDMKVFIVAKVTVYGNVCFCMAGEQDFL